MQIKRDLNLVLRKGERFDLVSVQREVKEYFASILAITKEEEQFWSDFSEGKYNPNLIFSDSDKVKNVVNHPMALWKCRNKE